MTTTLNIPTAAATPNAILAGALDTIARLLRDPQMPDVFSLHLGPTGYRGNQWKASLFPATSSGDAEVQALRAFAGLLAPAATFHLTDPQPQEEGAYRRLTAGAVRDGLHLEMWTHIACPTG